ncbi:hypothetical protein WJX72_001094 [[Myrmecia] bisecta]|uniref:Transmembrane protein 107 n=1 Tax=[Myrmecia] bisecta TaxID=41462 RepID=A0AAW1QQ03_9CHLO
MKILRAEEVTLPARFLTTSAHLIATLTILFALNETAALAKGSSGDQQKAKQTLAGLAWTAVACFAVEFVGLFTGISIFFTTANCFYIFCHFVGTILVALFVGEHWSIDTYIYFFVLFNALPCIVELLIAFCVLRLRLTEY